MMPAVRTKGNTASNPDMKIRVNFVQPSITNRFIASTLS